jgi:hypothetical protein
MVDFRLRFRYSVFSVQYSVSFSFKLSPKEIINPIIPEEVDRNKKAKRITSSPP